MFTRSLTAIAAVLPTSLKYRIARLKPLYASAMAWQQTLVRVETRAGALNWHMDGYASQSYIRGSYEPYMQESFLRFVRPGTVVYDVGAHIGFHALVCGLLAGRSGRVFAFEPDPQCRASLERQIAANPRLPLVVLPYALSDCRGELPLDTSKGSSQSRLHAEGNLLVEATSIDSLLQDAGLPPPHVIKIDVEGHEAAVLRGAKVALERYQPVVLCDYNDDNTLQVVQELLHPLGYKVQAGPPVTATTSR